MAISVLSKALFKCVFMTLLVAYMVNSIDAVVVQPPNAQNIDCGGACGSRCKLSSRPNLCNRACGTCCARCSCVPPGAFGNYDARPCYADMTTHGGRRKCP
ncbi:gibberellin-regulated protein 11-like [Cucurbita pepo subsp. pepo]|uniref:gibberellin-regulated protein 11-like n=1 Tax=Cucurbita pepo subsp. pepo TaxID=3664 RepID=UPI000C9D92D0|nr:gibberellin-regulated protein 11-like [Cucurbita pepo subsp. pepo]